MTAAVLTTIGCGALPAVDAERAIVIRVSTWQGAWPIIVQIGNEELVMSMVVVMPCMRKRRCRDHGQNCSHANKPDH